MSIQDLPDELLLYIFEPFADIQKHDEPFATIPHAKTSENTKSLASLSKVCVRWHSIIEPILYSTFTKPNNSETPSRTLRLFLRTIIERPHLANNITKLVLGSWSESLLQHRSPDPSDEILFSPPSSILRPTYSEALERLERSPSSPGPYGKGIRFKVLRNRLKHCILRGDEVSESALLLLLLAPNLRVLHLAQIPSTEQWTFTGIDGLTQAASHLNRIELGSVSKTLGVDDYRLRVLMTLPKLKNSDRGELPSQ